MLRNLGAATALLMALVDTAMAVPVTMTFTVSRFAPAGTYVAPTNPVTGTIIWDAASANADINSLSAVSLTLDGHTYALGELSFLSPRPFWPGDLIYGSIDGTGITTGMNDFAILFDVSNGLPQDFIYASSSSVGIWRSSTFNEFSITANHVPEPGSLALVGLAMLGLGLGRRSGR
jgi:hypothetical protein